ncbi:hypothetical protein JCM8097_008542 [Rhodosporidiobolus ruineniae]
MLNVGADSPDPSLSRSTAFNTANNTANRILHESQAVAGGMDAVQRQDMQGQRANGVPRPDSDDGVKQQPEAPSSPIAIPAPSSPSTSTSALPSAPSTAAPGKGPQRTPSLRAQAAFSRLRIGSFGGANRPAAPSPSSTANSPATTSPASSGFLPPLPAERTLSPDTYATPLPPSTAPSSSTPSPQSRAPRGSGISLASSLNRRTGSGTSDDSPAPSRAGSVRSASSRTASGMSPAASFLSAFSPSRRVSAATGAAREAGGAWPAFAGVLPPAGDEAGFVLRTKRGEIKLPASLFPSTSAMAAEDETLEAGEEQEWVLGEELGRGGMGVVREARLVRPKRAARRFSADDSAGAEAGAGEKEGEEEGEVKVAVKIIPRRRRRDHHPQEHHHPSNPSHPLHNPHQLPHTPALPSPSPSALETSQPLPHLRDPAALAAAAKLRDPAWLSTANSSQASSRSGSRAGSRASSLSRAPPFRDSRPGSRDSSLPPPSPASYSPGAPALPSPANNPPSAATAAADSLSKPSALGLGLPPSRIAQLERARSTSSPIRPRVNVRSRTGLSTIGASSRERVGTPLPSPGLTRDGGQGEKADEAMASVLGTSAPAESSLEKHAREREGENEAMEEKKDERMEEKTPEQYALDQIEDEDDLLDLLLQRELNLWGQLSALPPPASSSSSSAATAAAEDEGKREKKPGPPIVPLLGLSRTPDFDYVFMPLATGGTLLSYLTSPRRPPPSPSPSHSATLSSTGRSGSRSRPSSSRSRTRLTAAGKPRALHAPRHSSFSAASAPAAQPGLPLDQAGEVFLQVVDSLRWLHEVGGVAHRDVKLENVVGYWEEATSGSSSEVEGEDDEESDGEEERRARSESRHRREGRGRSRTRRGGDDTPPTSKRKKHKKLRRVWKLADFGLAELIPPPQPQHHHHRPAPSGAGAGAVQGVQPLAALARAGSLTRPAGHGRDGSAPGGPSGGGNPLAASVGPGTTKTAKAGAQTRSAFLPPPHGAGTGASPSPLLPSPAGFDHPSPLSALLHPVGSLPYSSPEALKSPVPLLSPSIDIWALGCVLYALVAGRLPIWEEWELRMRVRLVKGEWEVPDALAPTGGGEEDDHEKEKALALEVLRGCLDVDVGRRWTVGQVAESEWAKLVRRRRVEEKERRRRERRERSEQRRRQREMARETLEEEGAADEQRERERERIPPSPSMHRRGRQLARGPPPAPSAGAGTPAEHDYHAEGEMRPPLVKSKSKSRSRSRAPSIGQLDTHISSRSRSRGPPGRISPMSGSFPSLHHHHPSSSSHHHLSRSPSHASSLAASAASSTFPSPVVEEDGLALGLDLDGSSAASFAAQQWREQQERGRSERRWRWDQEEKEARRRSASRASQRSRSSVVDER